MITQIKDAEGKECLAIVFNNGYSLENVVALQSSLLWLISASTNSDNYLSLNEDLCVAAQFLIDTLFTPSQITNCESVIFPKP